MTGTGMPLTAASLSFLAGIVQGDDSLVRCMIAYACFVLSDLAVLFVL